MWNGGAAPTIAAAVSRFAQSARSQREAERQSAGRFAGICVSHALKHLNLKNNQRIINNVIFVAVTDNITDDF